MSAGAADVASLGLAVDSSQVKAATTALNEMGDAATKGEGRVKQILTATDALVSALNRNATATAGLTSRMDQMQAAGVKTADSITKVDQAADKATSSVDALAQATQKTSVAATTATKAVNDMASATTKHVANTNNAAAATIKSTTAANENTKAVGLSTNELRNLSFQLNDVATMALSGASAFQIMATQGGQVFQIAQMAGGGVKGILTQAGEAASALANRVGLVGGALGGLAAGFAVATTAAIMYRNEQKELERSTFGIGRASGASVQDMQDAALQAAASGKTSTSGARSVIGDLNSTGKVDPAYYSTVAKDLADIAKLMGKELPDAQETLVSALSSGTQGFDRLNAVLGLGGDALRKQVDDAYKVGDNYTAQGAILQALTQRVKEFKQETGEPGYFTRVFTAINRGMGVNTSDELNSIGSIFAKPTTEQLLAKARTRVDNLQTQSDAGLAAPGALDAARANVEKLEASLAKSAETSKVAKANLTSLTVNPLVESLNPAQKRIEDIQKQAKLIQDYLDNGGDKLDKDGAARRTMTSLKAQAEELTAELAKGGGALSSALERAQFALKTAGFSDYAKSSASYVEAARVEKQQIIATNPEGSERAAQIKAVDDKLAAQLKLLDTQVQQAGQQAASNGGGRFSKSVSDAPESMRAIILAAAAKYGQDPDQMSSMLYRESGYKNGKTSPAGAQGVAQFMPETAQRFGVDVTSVESSIEGMGKYLQVLGRMFGNGTADQIAAYNRGEGGQQKWINNGRDPSTQPKETREYVAAITTPRPGSMELTKETQERSKALELEAQKVRATTEAAGRDAEGLQARLEVMERVKDAQSRNIEVTKELLASYQQEASARAKLATESRMSAFTVQGQFDRDQLGRTSVEQRAYSQARQVTGSVDATTPLAKQVIQETKDNIALSETKQMASDALNGLASDLRRGATAAQAFSNALGRIADKALSSITDSLVSGLFKTGTGGGGGMGGIGDFFGGVKSFFGFANGGIMTPYGAAPLRTYAKGGIASSPQVAIYGEGDGNEAYVPLPDGKRIPVANMGGPANSNGPGGSTSVAYAPVYNFPQVPEMTPAQVAAFVDRKNQQLLRDLPGHIQTANRRRAS